MFVKTMKYENNYNKSKKISQNLTNSKRIPFYWYLHLLSAVNGINFENYMSLKLIFITRYIYRNIM